MYCSACGVQNSDGATHCVNCGSHLTEAIPQGIPVEPPVMPSPKTSGLAIASLVLAIFSLLCFPFAGIAAIICGIIALVKINSQQLKGTGFAIAGIAIPVIMVPFMLAILMPALSKVKQTAQTIVCSTNMQGLSTAMMVYMNDYDDRFPTSQQWCDLLIQEADVSPESFQCPDDPEGAFSYAINEAVYTVAPGQTDAQMVVLFESDLGKNAAGGLNDVVMRHQKGVQSGCNIVFADGHMEFVPEDRIATLQWTAE